MKPMISPNQSFEVKSKASIDSSQLWSLTHLYQPIMGSLALSLFLTLSQMTHNHSDQGKIRHSQLQQLLNVGIQDLNHGRQKLESLFLLDTYRDSNSHPDPHNQHIIYHIKNPLLVDRFHANPLLRTALIKQLGSSDYQQLVSTNLSKPMDNPSLQLINSNFSDAFYDLNIQEDPKEEPVDSPTMDMKSIDLDYAMFIRFMISENINHSLLTLELKEHVYALHQVYQLEVVDLVQIFVQSLNPSKDQIDYQMVYQLAEGYKKSQPTPNQNQDSETQEGSSIDGQEATHEFPLALNEQEKKARLETLKSDYPQLSEADRMLILSCEQITNVGFLYRMKKERNGYVARNEEKYLKDLLSKTKLHPAIVNFLIYYLLAVKERPNLYMGDLDRYANTWQQAGLKDVASVILYVRNQSKKQNTSYYGKGKSKKKYKEPIPEWMLEDHKDESEVDQEAAYVDPDKEKALREQLTKLFGEEDE